MGKKSREKREREYKLPPPPKFVYRYLPTKELAEGMLTGALRISTLREVREGESLRADARDATLNYRVSQAMWGTGGMKSPEAENLELLGVGVGNAEFSGFINCTFRVQYPDAYVLCTAMPSCDDKRMRRVFGQYRVRISDPLALMKAVSERMADHFARGFSARAGPVDYRGRDRHGPERLNVSSLYVGHPENAYESEWRIAWEPLIGPRPVQSLDLHVPELAKLCSMCD